MLFFQPFLFKQLPGVNSMLLCMSRNVTKGLDLMSGKPATALRIAEPFLLLWLGFRPSYVMMRSVVFFVPKVHLTYAFECPAPWG